MRVVSINVGLPNELVCEGRRIRTGIFKAPVEGRIRVRAENLEGDGQADLAVHGGPNKAVYAYPAEHYEFWRRELPGINFAWGMFGENLNTDGLLENALNIGDRLCIGSAEFVVTEPRLPCFKLGVKFGRKDIVQRFLKSRRSGFYLAVLREGNIGTGDAIEILTRDRAGLTLADLTELYAFKRNDIDGMRRAAAVRALPENWREYFTERLARALSPKRSRVD